MSLYILSKAISSIRSDMSTVDGIGDIVAIKLLGSLLEM
jgi:hypothetical protein